MLGPMKLIMAAELASTEALEISVFQRLSLANGRNPFRLAPCPALMALHALLLGLPPPPEGLLPPELPPLPDEEDWLEFAAPPPQPERAIPNTHSSAPLSILENRIRRFSWKTAAVRHGMRPPCAPNQDMYFRR